MIRYNLQQQHTKLVQTIHRDIKCTNTIYVKHKNTQQPKVSNINSEILNHITHRHRRTGTNNREEFNYQKQ